MMNFDYAVSKVLESEGEFVNHPQDRGGVTKYGVTESTLSIYRGKQITIQDMKALTIEEARLIYKKNYWDCLKLDFVKDKIVAYLIFDQAINRGVQSACKQIQDVVNVTTDGVIGPDTIGAINSFSDPRVLCVNFIKKSQVFYAKIVKNDPSQSVFILGWINRTHKLLDIVLNKGE